MVVAQGVAVDRPEVEVVVALPRLRLAPLVEVFAVVVVVVVEDDEAGAEVVGLTTHASCDQ